MILLGVFAVWLAWSVTEIFVTAPRWAWYLLVAILGLGWQLLEEPSTWWYGVGIGGGAAVLMLVTDWLLVSTDSAKLNALRSSRRQ